MENIKIELKDAEKTGVKVSELEKLSAEVDDDENEDLQEDKYLTFHICNEEYGIEIRCVTEIIGIQNITAVPDMPPYVKGVINLRGKVIPVMDVRSRFKLPVIEYNDRTCIVVISVNGQSIGLIVDYVSEVLDIPKTCIEPPLRIKMAGASNFISGLGKVGDRVKILLNSEKLLFEEDLDKLSNM